MTHDGEFGIREDIPGLSSLRGVARIERPCTTRKGRGLSPPEIPDDGNVLLARCLSQDAADSLVLAIT
jgi:hypothetical protein